MTKEEILNTLKAVKYPPYSKDIVSFGMVKYVKTDGSRAEVRIFTGGEKEAAKKVVLEAHTRTRSSTWFYLRKTPQRRRLPRRKTKRSRASK